MRMIRLSARLCWRIWGKSSVKQLVWLLSLFWDCKSFFSHLVLRCHRHNLLVFVCVCVCVCVYVYVWVCSSESENPHVCDILCHLRHSLIHVSAAGKCVRRYSLERQSACGRQEKEDEDGGNQREQVCVCVSVCVRACVCMWERERERFHT